MRLGNRFVLVVNQFGNARQIHGHTRQMNYARSNSQSSPPHTVVHAIICAVLRLHADHLPRNVLPRLLRVSCVRVCVWWGGIVKDKKSTTWHFAYTRYMDQ